MNSQEYKEYEADVADFFKREGITNLSSTYNDETGEGYMEPYFSWGPCDCCGSTLGGDRQECAGWNPTDKTVHGPFNVCTDCEYYAEYGQLDDMTMMDIEEDQKEIKRRHAEDIAKEVKEIHRRQAAAAPVAKRHETALHDYAGNPSEECDTCNESHPVRPGECGQTRD